MSATIGSTILRSLGATRRDERNERAVARRLCPHCGRRGAAFPSGADENGEPLVCPECGSALDLAGELVRACSECGGLRFRGRPHRECPPAPGLLGDAAHQEAAAARADELLGQLFARVRDRRLESYLARIAAELAPGPALAVRALLDEGEPLIAALPEGGLALSLGLLASLEDEAELAFLVAREGHIAAAGHAARRFGAALWRSRRLLARLTPGLARDPFARALVLSLRFGYGREVEAEADRAALQHLVRADYCPASAARALERLEDASIEGRGARFIVSLERRGVLSREGKGFGLARDARVNREVFRRAVGGFAVFSRTR